MQAQYLDIKKQCADVNVEIIGKCDVIQRVVQRNGQLVFEKGIRGRPLTELMRISISSLKK